MNNPPTIDDLVSLLDEAVKRFNNSKDGRTLLGSDYGLEYQVREFRVAHEQAISHRLAFYLEDALRHPDVKIITDEGALIVDCEYNQHRFGRKLVQILRAEAGEFIRAGRTAIPVEGRDDLVQFEIRPDILIHQRGIDGPTNLMVLEVKRWTNPEKKHDQQKLMLLSKLDLNTYGYVVAAAVYARNDLKGEDRVLQIGPRFHGGMPC